MAEPLNPMLYSLLLRRFGEVQISDEGAAMRARVRHDFFSNRPKLEVDEPGEYYRVNCPFCHDTRLRLYVNHRWGVRDSLGGRNLWLMCCFNEHCEREMGRTRDLFDMITEFGDRLAQAHIRRGRVPSKLSGPITLPGEVIRVDRLPPTHEAAAYLGSRFFDVDRVGKVYGVLWCEESRYFMAKHRLIIPIYAGGVLRGWQARYPGERDWKAPNSPPKYYNCPGMTRRTLIYNFDQAQRYKTGVICEGVTDVWSFGGMSMALLGSSMSEEQERQIVAAFAEGSVVLLLDPDLEAKEGFRKMARRLRMLLGKSRFCVVIPPGGKDPAELDRELLRDHVLSEASRQGASIEFARKD